MVLAERESWTRPALLLGNERGHRGNLGVRPRPSREVAGVAYSEHPEVGLDIAIIAADEPVFLEDVRSKLLATGRFGSVTLVNARFVTPTLDELRPSTPCSYSATTATPIPRCWETTWPTTSMSGGSGLCDIRSRGLSRISSNTLHGRWQDEGYYVLTRSST